MSLVSIRLPDDLERKLAREAERSHRAKSEVARDAIMDYLSRQEKERFLADIARAAHARGHQEALVVASEALALDNESMGIVERENTWWIWRSGTESSLSRAAKETLMRRGEIWLGNLNPNRGAEVGKVRPVLVIQADFLLVQGEPTVIVLPLTTQVRKSKEPLHVTVVARDSLEEDCQVMPEQPRTLDRRRLIEGPLTRLSNEELAAVERSLMAVMGLYSYT